MANAIGINSSTGGAPMRPRFRFEVNFAFDTYATGGVDMAALLALDSDWKASKLSTDSIVSGTVNLDADAQGVIRMADWDNANKKLVLKVPAAGPMAEQANGAIGATVNGTLSLEIQ